MANWLVFGLGEIAQAIALYLRSGFALVVLAVFSATARWPRDVLIRMLRVPPLHARAGDIDVWPQLLSSLHSTMSGTQSELPNMPSGCASRSC